MESNKKIHSLVQGQETKYFVRINNNNLKGTRQVTTTTRLWLLRARHFVLAPCLHLLSRRRDEDWWVAVLLACRGHMQHDTHFNLAGKPKGVSSLCSFKMVITIMT